MEQLHISTDKGLMTNSVIINPSHLAPRTWTEKPQKAKEEVLKSSPQGHTGCKVSQAAGWGPAAAPSGCHAALGKECSQEWNVCETAETT